MITDTTDWRIDQLEYEIPLYDGKIVSTRVIHKNRDDVSLRYIRGGVEYKFGLSGGEALDLAMSLISLVSGYQLVVKVQHPKEEDLEDPEV
jgi:hypothetical protein